MSEALRCLPSRPVFFVLVCGWIVVLCYPPPQSLSLSAPSETIPAHLTHALPYFFVLVLSGTGVLYVYVRTQKGCAFSIASPGGGGQPTIVALAIGLARRTECENMFSNAAWAF